MAWVSCNICDWGEEVEDDNELEALQAFAEHKLSVHPHRATDDSAVRLWIQIHTASIATTNGGYHYQGPHD